MKIFQLIQKSQLRGAEIFACQLSNALNQKGHECTIISLFPGDRTLPFSGKVISLGLSKKRRLIDWFGLKKLAMLVNNELPDIVQANAGDTLKYAIISKLIFRWRAKIVFRNASTVSLYIRNPIIKRWNAFLYSQTDQVVSVSKHTRDDLKKIFPVVSCKITVAPIGVERVDFSNQRTPQNNPIVLLHVGGFTFEKNHDGLVKIFGEIRRHRQDVELWLVGDGPLRSQTENLTKRLNLKEYVKFWGYQPDPSSFFCKAKVFLLPSIIEGLPAVILESFCYELPVVAYDVGGIRELVRNGETGYLIEKGNEKDFAAATLKALQGRAETILLSKNALDLVAREYTMEKVADRFNIIYEKLLNNCDGTI